MSIYQTQEFVSPDILFAEVKEELSSYFASGAIDDLMFPRWTELCLRKLKKAGFKKDESVVHIKDYMGCLPDDFSSVREAWMCTCSTTLPINVPSAQYYQTDCRIDKPELDLCDPCFETQSCTTEFTVVHKVTSSVQFKFQRTVLLTPGNVTAKKCCSEGCPNLFASTPYSFSIANGKLVTNFSDGIVNLVYYAIPSENEVMVPDNYWIQDYIKKFITFKCFSKLSNIVTDETFNQIDRKKQEAKQESEIAFIVAETELKKETVQDKMRKIRQTYDRNNIYRLPGDQSYLNSGY